LLTKFLALFSESTPNHSACTHGTPLSITVAGVSGPTVVVEMQDNDTVGALRARVAAQIAIEASQLTLIRMSRAREGYSSDSFFSVCLFSFSIRFSYELFVLTLQNRSSS
jgi:hypothetical protein